MNKTIYYQQPIISLRTGDTVASELLLRKHHELLLQDMLSSPDLFERYLGGLVDSKIKHINELKAQGALNDRIVFLNFTPNQVRSHLFPSALEKIRKACTKVQCITIEVTENEVTDNWKGVIKNLLLARSLGFLIAIDDFGAGYSNFNSIYKVEPDIVKLDLGLIEEGGESLSAECNFYRLVEFLHSIKVRVVIEGIETLVHERIAKYSNAEFGQGFFYHRPKAIFDVNEAKKPEMIQAAKFVTS